MEGHEITEDGPSPVYRLKHGILQKEIVEKDGTT
jgi:hypothetical protein